MVRYSSGVFRHNYGVRLQAGFFPMPSKGVSSILSERGQYTDLD